MSKKELLEQGFASQAEFDGFVARMEEALDEIDTSTEEFVCTCQDCEVQRAA